MAHKIFGPFKKRTAFQETKPNNDCGEVRIMFEDLSKRLDKVEKTLEELTTKK